MVASKLTRFLIGARCEELRRELIDRNTVAAAEAKIPEKVRFAQKTNRQNREKAGQALLDHREAGAPRAVLKVLKSNALETGKKAEEAIEKIIRPALKKRSIRFTLARLRSVTREQVMQHVAREAGVSVRRVKDYWLEYSREKRLRAQS